MRIFFIVCLFPLQAFAKDNSLLAGSAIHGGELLRIAGGLVIILMLILALSWLIKRLNRGGLGLSGPFQMIANTHLGAREKIMMIKVGDRFLLVGVASGSINTLYDFGQNLPEGFQQQEKPVFSQLLKQVMGKC